MDKEIGREHYTRYNFDTHVPVNNTFVDINYNNNINDRQVLYKDDSLYDPDTGKKLDVNVNQWQYSEKFW